MQRSTLFIATVLLVISAVAQPPGLDRNAMDGNGKKQGLWTKTWPSTGKVRYQGQFKDDKPFGKFRYYNEDGELTSTMEFKVGSDATWSVHFHPEGTIMAKGMYLGQIKDSTWHYFDSHGQLRKTETYVEGKPHGLVTSYFRDGSVAERIRFDNGVQVEEWKQYYANGNTRAEGVFVKGEPEGIMTWYYESGKPEIKGKYSGGLKNGAWIYYNDDGSVQLQMLYEQGEFIKSSKENGLFKDYYDDDQVKNEVTWKNGQKNGPFTEYYNNGVWVETKSKPDLALGIKGGEPERVLEGQTVRLTGNYKNDKLHGKVKSFNEKGKMINEVEYIEGIEQ